MNSKADLSVTIIGAGIGGLTLAAALDTVGVRSRIVEQATRFARIGAGIQMTPNAVKVLRGIGLADRLRAIAYDSPFRTSREWDTGREILRIPMGEALEERYGAPHLLLHRGDLHQTLLSRVGEDRIRFGARVVGVASGEDGVQLSFEDGSVEETDIVIAADGVHSVTREALFDVTPAVYSGTIAYRSVFPSALLPRPLLDPKSKWRGPDRQISIYYVGDGGEVYFTTRVPFPEPVRESFSLEADLDELREAFSGFHAEVRDFLAACPRAQKWAIYERDPLPTWIHDRVALLGDAAHPMTPSMAQGAAQSMEDAAVLSRCLAEDPMDVRTAFDRYFRTRYERASTVQTESSRDQWNWTTAGSSVTKVDSDYVYGYVAWTVPLAPATAAVAR
jgi:salicylate hydroxylase/6-hydroxynicotinate 3-monooxygenase